MISNSDVVFIFLFIVWLWFSLTLSLSSIANGCVYSFVSCADRFGLSVMLKKAEDSFISKFNDTFVGKVMAGMQFERGMVSDYHA